MLLQIATVAFAFSFCGQLLPEAADHLPRSPVFCSELFHFLSFSRKAWNTLACAKSMSSMSNYSLERGAPELRFSDSGNESFFCPTIYLPLHTIQYSVRIGKWCVSYKILRVVIILAILFCQLKAFVMYILFFRLPILMVILLPLLTSTSSRDSDQFQSNLPCCGFLRSRTPWMYVRWSSGHNILLLYV